VMVPVKDAFIDAWRSHRIQKGDDAASLPDPLGRNKEQRTRKKRKVDTAPVDVDSGGGFFVEEEQGDGKAVQEEDSQGEDTSSQDVQYIPLSSVPDALATLSLPSNDEFVLSLFAQTATYIQTDARRRRRPVITEDGSGGDEKMVSLHDFQRVVEVLQDADTGGQAKSTDEEEDEEEDGEDDEDNGNPPSSSRRPIRAAASTANKRRRKQIRNEDIDEEASSGEDEFHSIDFAREEEEEDYEEEERNISRRTVQNTKMNKKKDQKSSSGGMRRSRKQSKKADDTTATDEAEEEDEGHLTATQRKTVNAAFSLFIGKLRELKGDQLDEQPRLGKDDLKLLVAHVGEKISDKDVRFDILEDSHLY
jgi:hypothetical protein